MVEAFPNEENATQANSQGFSNVRKTMKIPSPEKSSRAGMFSDRIHTEVLPSQTDIKSMQKPSQAEIASIQRQASNAPDVLASGEKINSEI